MANYAFKGDSTNTTNMAGPYTCWVRVCVNFNPQRKPSSFQHFMCSKNSFTLGAVSKVSHSKNKMIIQGMIFLKIQSGELVILSGFLTEYRWRGYLTWCEYSFSAKTTSGNPLLSRSDGLLETKEQTWNHLHLVFLAYTLLPSQDASK